MSQNYYESDLADEVYDKLFDNTKNQTISWCGAFPDASVDNDQARIYLNDKFVIKIERI